ncbi:MAG: RluA family pseudouridine synthase [Lachnospiraceae bacterium]|nr:RluA family pseudouridine synthase [Lachnospiraceae bacterium]
MSTEKIIVGDDRSGIRIDRYLSEIDGMPSRSYLQKLVRNGEVTVNGQKIKANYQVLSGDEIDLTIPEPVELTAQPEDIPLDILYEDSDIIVINKPKGMVVHPGAGHASGTLVNGLLYHCKGDLSGINGVLRPGIVHRIDMNTTGVLVVCKTDTAHQFIAEQLKVHSITRRYEAIVHGIVKNDGTIEGAIGRKPNDRIKMAIVSKGGKPAVTHYHVIEQLKGYSHISCELETGRTHQIRVHMSSLNHPILGDNLYGPTKCPFVLEGQTLHARVLGFIHPSTREYMEFEAPLPAYFSELLEKLRS